MTRQTIYSITAILCVLVIVGLIVWDIIAHGEAGYSGTITRWWRVTLAVAGVVFMGVLSGHLGSPFGQDCKWWWPIPFGAAYVATWFFWGK